MNILHDFSGYPEAHGGGPATLADTGAATLRIWMVDDSDNFRSLLASLLDDQPGLACPRHFASPSAVLATLVTEAAPDVILLDVHMREANGLDAIAPIRAVAPMTRVLMLTTFFDHRTKATALQRGAAGFLLKSFSLDRIIAGIHAACRQPLTAETPEVAVETPGADAPSISVSRQATPTPRKEEFRPLLERAAVLMKTFLERRRKVVA